MRRAPAAIMAALLSHEGPMTLSGIEANTGLCGSTIYRAARGLEEHGLIERAGFYVNPGTGRRAVLLGVGPLVRMWAALNLIPHRDIQ